MDNQELSEEKDLPHMVHSLSDPVFSLYIPPFQEEIPPQFIKQISDPLINQFYSEKEYIKPPVITEKSSQQELPPQEPVPILFREPSSSDPEAPDSSHLYFQELGNLRLQLLEESDGNFSDFLFGNSSISDSALSRVNKEIKALTRSLPCEPGGSVFVAINSNNLGMIKVLIAGTEDSPYEHGLFLFDLRLPEDYPNNPPEMNIRTTGNGVFRFNPNLYDTGYICLSIINTWGGDPEEMWNPTYSTLLQVFLSIQALVMNKDVIQKEPGYEHYETNSRENLQYKAIVSYGNIKYAMTDMIRTPPQEFKEIIRKHFLLKREKILETIEKWREEALKIDLPVSDEIILAHNASTVEDFETIGIAECFNEAIEELKTELKNLK